ncbi:hypothetical protein [Methanospirillum purgamenti]|jgi:hypothetical protein|nr:hypothetical protein [Methanospirillum hungatei]
MITPMVTIGGFYHNQVTHHLLQPFKQQAFIKLISVAIISLQA